MFRLIVCLVAIGYGYSEAAVGINRSRSLRLVIVLFRHGDRSPISTYHSDPYEDYPWIGGFLALQPKGIEQMFELGQNLRNRYGFLIPDHGMYTSDTVSVLSSASERCILTAQSLLASFYKPPKGAVDIPIQWQPVPVHVLKPEEDIILGQRRFCPRLNAIREELFLNPTAEFEQWHHNGSVLQDYVSEQIGKKLPSLRQLFEIFDALEVQHKHGLDLPHWASKIFPDQTDEFVRGYQLTFSATDELKRIRGGAILNEFLEKMKSKRNGSMWPDRSFLFYSAHDVTQTNLFNTMGIEELLKGRPGYGATTVFELYETLGSDMEVRMAHYSNTRMKTPIELEIPNCAKPCSLTNFERSVGKMLLDDYDRACGSDDFIQE